MICARLHRSIRSRGRSLQAASKAPLATGRLDDAASVSSCLVRSRFQTSTRNGIDAGIFIWALVLNAACPFDAYPKCRNVPTDLWSL